jgi:hypothetical protein
LRGLPQKSIGAVKLRRLSNKQSRVAGVTEDWATENVVRSTLIERLRQLDAVESHLSERFTEINYYVSKFDKLPTQDTPTLPGDGGDNSIHPT